ncbi:hypothetical protein METP3_00126 [Methanosarcinales archaeon]|nr:hypothetical protein METP3_00126 [Methanosarcinales archaeon]
MRILTFLIFFFVLWTGTSSAVYFNKYDIEWDNATSGTLYRGESFMGEEYTIKAVQFFGPVPGIKNLQGNIVPDSYIIVDPSVNLEIYKDGIFVKEIILKNSSSPYIDPDYEYRVSTVEFPKRNSREWVYEYYKPWAKITIEKRAKPELEIRIITDKNPYTSYSDSMIRARVNIINKGGAFVKDVAVNLSIGDLKATSNDIKYFNKSFQRIDRHALDNFEVILYVPKLTEDRIYVLSADAKGYDAKGLEYATSNSSNVAVKTEHYFHLSKSARDRIYLADDDTVKIVASNGGVYDIYNITIQDSINENFELEQNSTLEWNIPQLKPGQDWETTYKIKALRTNIDGFKIPEAVSRITVNNRPYKVTSGETKIIVNGPIIVLNKTVDKDYAYTNEDVTVTVTINNIGNIPTRVEVKDFIPEGIFLVSGETSLAPTFLELNDPKEFSYIIRRNIDSEVQLPPAEANFTDIKYRGPRWVKMFSNMPNITFLDTSKPKPTSVRTPVSNDTGNKSNLELQKANFSTPSPTTQPTPMTPGFSSIYSIIMFMIITLLRQKRV